MVIPQAVSSCFCLFVFLFVFMFLFCFVLFFFVVVVVFLLCHHVGYHISEFVYFLILTFKFRHMYISKSKVSHNLATVPICDGVLFF